MGLLIVTYNDLESRSLQEDVFSLFDEQRQVHVHKLIISFTKEGVIPSKSMFIIKLVDAPVRGIEGHFAEVQSQ